MGMNPVYMWSEDYPEYGERLRAMAHWVRDGFAGAMIDLWGLALVE